MSEVPLYVPPRQGGTVCHGCHRSAGMSNRHVVPSATGDNMAGARGVGFDPQSPPVSDPTGVPHLKENAPF